VKAAVLPCPKCGAVHVDEGVWATKEHKTHQCQACGHKWRPYSFPTVGVAGPVCLGVPPWPGCTCGTGLVTGNNLERA
jgi:predicted RNA-binding Zn-ribbon protein involved in translation (DUF1610 family)